MFQLSLLPGSQLGTAEARGQFGMQTRWRVVPRCVGDYVVLGWLKTMTTLPAGTSVARIVKEFLIDQDNQFWSDRVGLLDHATRNVDWYLSGEVGNNLIYTA